MLLTDPSAHPVIAHRGNSAHAPENTLEAFDQAIALGADALEFDVRLTSDGEVVVIHDPTLERTTSGRGPVDAYTLRELRGHDAGARFTSDGGRTFPYRERGLRVPTLADVLERYPTVPCVIEVKVAAAVEPTRGELARANATARTLVDSADYDAVAPFRGGAMATGASMREVLRLLAGAALPFAPRALPYDALCIPRRYNGVPVPVARLARATRRAGVVTHVWTINDASIARRLWRAGIQGLITDDPASMLRVRAALFGSSQSAAAR